MKAKHDKSIWQPEVQILLNLKKKLSDLISGSSKPTEPSQPKNKKPEVVFVPEQNGGASVDIASLESAIAKQVCQDHITIVILIMTSMTFHINIYLYLFVKGDLVRELKAKEQKSVWQPEVEKLLKLKKQLADLTGTTPAPTDKKSKKKK